MAPIARHPARLAAVLAGAAILAVGCAGETPNDLDAGSPRNPIPVPAADTLMDDGTMTDTGAMSSTDSTLGASSDDGGGAPEDVAGTETASVESDPARQRCLTGAEALERRIDAEGFEWPEEGPELSEEELEQLLAPEFPNVDGVAAPDERASIEPMPAFDPEMVPIPELDWLVGACIEGNVVSERELFGDDDEGDEAEGDDEDWCAELAELDAATIAEFAAEEGEDIVRSEFAECGLPDPLGS